MSDKRTYLTIAATLFCAAMFFNWVLLLAYPYGFITIETPNWIETAQRSSANYFLYSLNDDWFRSIPYGLVMLASEAFANPSNAVSWLQCTLFAVNVVLVFALTERLFYSKRAGCTLAAVFLAVEIFSMRLMFFNLQISADPFFSELIVTGTLLALWGWLRKSFALSAIGYGCFGLVIFTKAAGSFLLAIWLPFAFFTVFRAEKSKGRLQRFAALFCLIAAPMIFLCARNQIMYGCPKPSAASSFMLLAKSFATMRDTDAVLEYPQLNKEFIDEYHKLVDFYWHDDFSRKYYPRLDHFLDEAYFQDRVKFGPYHMLAKLNTGKLLDRWDSRQMYCLDRPMLHAAWRLIALHPTEFAALVAGEYYRMFQPLDAVTIESEKFTNSQSAAYAETAGWAQWYANYPPHDKVDLSRCNVGARNFLAALALNPLVTNVLNAFYAVEFYLCHACFFAFVIAFAAATCKNSPMRGNRFVLEISGVQVMLFATAALYNAQVALVEISRTRYMMSSEPLLRLMLLLAAALVLRAIWRFRLLTRGS